jgi:hypothetical protein
MIELPRTAFTRGEMSMLELVPLGWFSWDFSVLQSGSPIAEIRICSRRERGVLAVGGSRYNIYREGMMSGQFILELNGTQLAHAEKRSWRYRSFTVQHEDKTYILKAESAFRQTFLLSENDRQIGSISPARMFKRKAMADLPDELPLSIKVFLLWLTVILWKRDSEAAVSAAAAG